MQKEMAPLRMDYSVTHVAHSPLPPICSWVIVAFFGLCSGEADFHIFKMRQRRVGDIKEWLDFR